MSFEIEEHLGPFWKMRGARTLLIGWFSTLKTGMRHPGALRRLFIAVAAMLVCGYAVSVLVYVLSAPEIGVRCAFSTVVNHFYPEFLYTPEFLHSENAEPLQEGDKITQIADQAT